MTFGEIAAVATPPCIVGLFSILLSYLNRQRLKDAKQEIQGLHVLINSNLQRWIALAVAEALARGTAEGIEKERVRLTSPSSEVLLAIQKGIAEGLLKQAAERALVDVHDVPPGTDPRVPVVEKG